MSWEGVLGRTGELGGGIRRDWRAGRGYSEGLVSWDGVLGGTGELVGDIRRDW